MSLYLRPGNLQEALDGLSRAPAVIAAGCTDLFPATERPALGGPVLDITAIAALRGIAETADGWRIGATTTWTDIARADLPPGFDMLKQAAREVGSTQIQNAGTLAGNLCNASPAADGVPPLLALDAAVEMACATGSRRMPLSDFITGPRATALRPGELLTAVHIPQAAGQGASRFLKLGARKYLVISIAMVAARIVVDDGGRAAHVALAVGACGPVATRLPGVERALTGLPLRDLTGAIDADAVAAALSPIDDLRADAAYRRHAAAELLRRAVSGAVSEPEEALR
ncbi:FAD binding domain-containing protein [Antarcticimicrobium luteum]|uniref:Xanthine dehydrogenase family protein subunit M n=1 Tax=Antarcticimicrobium luteum TaxID=2547397 RepID=A0A4R5UXA5_9RHOB|nr:FAD binding domain-containing protein [Antarcticimicrobium luteum]TDK43964.1 xanthine dehydrogenase family protein subunit M [Antarcticimicrobium luteum]